MSAHGKNRLMEAVRKGVLPQQVPDAEVLGDISAFQRFGLSEGSLSFLPDIVAFSKHHNTRYKYTSYRMLNNAHPVRAYR